MKKLILLLFLATATLAKAQNLHNGDSLVNLMHKSIDSAAVTALINEYNMKNDMPNAWAGGGLTFYAPDRYVIRMTFLKSDKDWGSYKGTLPLGLTFSMKLSDLQKKFPDGEAKDGYFKFSSGGHAYEVKFTSNAMKKIEFIAVTY